MAMSSDANTARAVAQHYDELDAFYRTLWGEHLHHGLWVSGDETPAEAARNLTERVLQEAQIQPGDAVCDVGCGYGATARLLSERGARVTALTLSEAQHRYAAAQTDGENPTYRLQDWLDNELPADSFEAVIAIESLGHMPDRRRALAEMQRVLRPGGRAVFCAWLAAEQPRPWERRFLLEPICREGQLPSPLPSASDYRRWLGETGLMLGTFEDLSRGVRRTWSICIRRVGRRSSGIRATLPFCWIAPGRTAPSRLPFCGSGLPTAPAPSATGYLWCGTRRRTELARPASHAARFGRSWQSAQRKYPRPRCTIQRVSRPQCLQCPRVTWP